MTIFLLFMSALAVLLFVDGQYSSMARLVRSRARNPESRPEARSGRQP